MARTIRHQTSTDKRSARKADRHRREVRRTLRAPAL